MRTISAEIQCGVEIVRNNSERTRELGTEGPQLAGASSYSNGCQQGEAKNLIFTVLDRIFRRLCSWLWALTSCFLISIVEVKVQHRGREEFL